MKSERLGLWMVAASLLAIGLVVGLLLHSQQESRQAQIRGQAASLARLLSSMRLERLAPPPGQPGPLGIVASTRAESEFAYAVVEDPAGRPLAQTVAPAVVVPAPPAGTGPASWYGERVVADGETLSYREFRAPVLDGGELAAVVRIGYREPGLLPAFGQLRFLALLALPVFLLVPAFYLLIKRELSGLRRVSSQIRERLEDDPIRAVELTASGEVAEFVQNFNRVVAEADRRIRLLEEQNVGTLNSTKVLSYQKARVESVLQSLPDPVVILDEEGKVTFASRKLRGLLGIDPEAIIGATPHEWCTEEALLGFVAGVGATGAGRRFQPGAVEFSPADTPEKRVAVSAFPLFSPRDDSNVFGTIVLFHDASAEAMAREARKEFVAHLSHELKTPLHVVGMYAETLRDGEGDAEQVRLEAGNVIFDEVERMTGLIKNLLSITEIEMGSIAIERTRTRVHDLLEDIVGSGARYAGSRDVSIELDVVGELDPVNVDKDLMRVAINNLVSNAVKYNRPGGKVRVRAEETPDGLRIAVRDDGIGISEADLPRVFDRFFRSDGDEARERQGNGLGLALAREIVTLHNGNLDVESRLGEGTEFTIVLESTANRLKEAI